MLDPSIQQFLDERKAAWLKKKVKPSLSDDEVQTLEVEANDLFALPTWLPEAAKRAKQLSLVSHPAKFSHPSAKSSAIIAKSEYKTDGYLRSGNVEAGLDVFGNAAAMDVYKFLMLLMPDGKTVLAHLDARSEFIQQQFTMNTATFDELSSGLLAIKTSDDPTKPVTSGGIKQVYFPVNDDRDAYHLLSVMTPSNLMFSLKKRLNTLRFSDEKKAAKEAKRAGQYHEAGYADIYSLTAIGFGGTKPQNISVMNSQNGGVSLLLESLPPPLDFGRVTPPRDDFFRRQLRLNTYRPAFESLQADIALFSEKGLNNMNIRRRIRGQVLGIFYQAIEQSWTIRRLPAGWSDAERCQALPKAQKVWLDQQYQQRRAQETDWLETVKQDMARWFLQTYQKTLKNKDHRLSDFEFLTLERYLDDCEGGLL